MSCLSAGTRCMSLYFLVIYDILVTLTTMDFSLFSVKGKVFVNQIPPKLPSALKPMSGYPQPINTTRESKENQTKQEDKFPNQTTTVLFAVEE